MEKKMAAHMEGTLVQVKGLCGAMLISLCAICSGVNAHEGRPHPDVKPGVGILAQNVDADSGERIAGQAPFQFRVYQTSAILDPLVREHLSRAHGGFAVDRRPGRREVYFAIPGAGIIRIESDLQSSVLLKTPPEMVDLPLHNTAISYDTKKQTAWLTFPSLNLTGLYTTSLDGKLKHILPGPPRGMVFDAQEVTTWFAGRARFIPTDVEFMDDRLYVTTGYSRLDYVLIADVKKNGVPTDTWRTEAFGGKGVLPGRLSTGHGLTRSKNGRQLVVADRENHELDYFDPDGSHVRTISLPKGSQPCDVDIVRGLKLVACLNSPVKELSAPIYIMRGDDIASTIRPKTDLGLANFDHLHNAVWVVHEGLLYIVVQAWNPGDFVILQQVIQ